MGFKRVDGWNRGNHGAGMPIRTPDFQLLVPGEGLEPPTFGLQNVPSTLHMRSSLATVFNCYVRLMLPLSKRGAACRVQLDLKQTVSVVGLNTPSIDRRQQNKLNSTICFALPKTPKIPKTYPTLPPDHFRDYRDSWTQTIPKHFDRHPTVIAPAAHPTASG